MLHMSSPLNARLQRASAENLLEEGISYNRQCYEDLTSKTHKDRATDRYKGGRTGSATVIKQKKAGRPPSSRVLESMSTSQKHIPEITISTNINVSSAKKSQ